MSLKLFVAIEIGHGHFVEREMTQGQLWTFHSDLGDDLLKVRQTILFMREAVGIDLGNGLKSTTEDVAVIAFAVK